MDLWSGHPDEAVNLPKLITLHEHHHDVEYCLSKIAASIDQSARGEDPGTSAKFNQRGGFALQWLLGQMNSECEAGEKFRSSGKAWDLVKDLIRELEPAKLRQTLDQRGFWILIDQILEYLVSVERDAERERYRRVREPGTHKLSTRPTNGLSDKSTSNKRRKLHHQSEGPTSTEGVTSASCVQTFRAICTCVKTFRERVVTSEAQNDRHEVQNAVNLSCNLAGRILGHWLEIINAFYKHQKTHDLGDHLSVQTPVWLWNLGKSETSNVVRECARAFSKPCLLPAAYMTTYAQRTVHEPERVDRVSPNVQKENTEALKPLISMFTFDASRSSEFAQRVPSNPADLYNENLQDLLAPIRSEFDLVSSGMKPGLDDLQDMYLSYLIPAVIDSVSQKQSKIESDHVWIESVFQQLTQYSSFQITSLGVELKTWYVRLLDQMILAIVGKGVELSGGTLRVLVEQFGELYSPYHQPNWLLLEAIAAMNPMIFLEPQIRDTVNNGTGQSELVRQVLVQLNRYTIFDDSKFQDTYDEPADEYNEVWKKLIGPIIQAFSTNISAFLSCWYEALLATPPWYPFQDDFDFGRADQLLVWETKRIAALLKDALGVSLTLDYVLDLIEMYTPKVRSQNHNGRFKSTDHLFTNTVFLQVLVLSIADRSATLRVRTVIELLITESFTALEQPQMTNHSDICQLLKLIAFSYQLWCENVDEFRVGLELDYVESRLTRICDFYSNRCSVLTIGQAEQHLEAIACTKSVLDHLRAVNVNSEKLSNSLLTSIASLYETLERCDVSNRICTKVVHILGERHLLIKEAYDKADDRVMRALVGLALLPLKPPESDLRVTLVSKGLGKLLEFMLTRSRFSNFWKALGDFTQFSHSHQTYFKEALNGLPDHVLLYDTAIRHLTHYMNVVLLNNFTRPLDKSSAPYGRKLYIDLNLANRLLEVSTIPALELASRVLEGFDRLQEITDTYILHHLTTPSEFKSICAELEKLVLNSMKHIRKSNDYAWREDPHTGPIMPFGTKYESENNLLSRIIFVRATLKSISYHSDEEPSEIALYEEIVGWITDELQQKLRIASEYTPSEVLRSPAAGYLVYVVVDTVVSLPMYVLRKYPGFVHRASLILNHLWNIYGSAEEPCLVPASEIDTLHREIQCAHAILDGTRTLELACAYARHESSGKYSFMGVERILSNFFEMSHGHRFDECTSLLEGFYVTDDLNKLEDSSASKSLHIANLILNKSMEIGRVEDRLSTVLLERLLSCLRETIYSTSSIHVFVSATQNIELLLSGHPGAVPQNRLEAVLISINRSIVAVPNVPERSIRLPQKESARIFQGFLGILTVVARQYRRRLGARYDVFTSVSQILLRWLFVVYPIATANSVEAENLADPPQWRVESTPEPLTSLHSKQMAGLIKNLCEPTVSSSPSGGNTLNDEATEAKQYAGQYARSVLKSLCVLHLYGTPWENVPTDTAGAVGGTVESPNMMESLRASVYALFGAMGKEAVKEMVEGREISGGMRTVLKEWWEEWRRERESRET